VRDWQGMLSAGDRWTACVARMWQRGTVRDWQGMYSPGDGRTAGVACMLSVVVFGAGTFTLPN